jgi:hypothetical protein
MLEAFAVRRSLRPRALGNANPGDDDHLERY